MSAPHPGYGDVAESPARASGLYLFADGGGLLGLYLPLRQVDTNVLTA